MIHTLLEVGFRELFEEEVWLEDREGVKASEDENNR